MAYRIAYAGQAEAALRALPRQRRTQIDTAMRSTIANNPYGHGSTAPRPRERDYREVSLPAANAIVVYYVSAPAALTITAVRLISL
ncbi:type II toxin-antitoxin system RelE/ParE family toxin [Streptomyces jumonjinensis]|uniref:type II toxin-antitoxin system RelE/ParE family toxin n=1 Tax=Streptomyces jumonjinensis TaxID=1945 RepID=UPI0037A5E15A